MLPTRTAIARIGATRRHASASINGLQAKPQNEASSSWELLHQRYGCTGAGIYQLFLTESGSDHDAGDTARSVLAVDHATLDGLMAHRGRGSRLIVLYTAGA